MLDRYDIDGTVLASDIDPELVRFASQGRYRTDEVGLPTVVRDGR